ncbi:hypothetical protein EV360DRAFT_55760, partial [Lentinula raphanica]
MNHEHFGFEDDPLQRRFGDPLAERLEFLLHTSSPFPGEPIDDNEFISPDRFTAYQVSATEHVLMDSAYDGEDCVISSAHLANPDFEPVLWFAKKLNGTFGRQVDLRGVAHSQMGDPRGQRVVQILNHAMDFPGDDLPDFHPRQ